MKWGETCGADMKENEEAASQRPKWYRTAQPSGQLACSGCFHKAIVFGFFFSCVPFSYIFARTVQIQKTCLKSTQKLRENRREEGRSVVIASM